VQPLIGLIPGFVPRRSHFNITVALGCVAFGAYHAYGVREHGIGTYSKHFLGPVLLIAPLMLVIEIFSHAFRPISLGVRLYANMFADHTVVEIFTDLSKKVLDNFYLPIPMAVIFYALGFFVCIVQSVRVHDAVGRSTSRAPSRTTHGGHEEHHH
jgi:F-type H+-transporting ATPase subunit a